MKHSHDWLSAFVFLIFRGGGVLLDCIKNICIYNCIWSKRAITIAICIKNIYFNKTCGITKNDKKLEQVFTKKANNN